MLFEEVIINTRFVVVAFQERFRGKLHEVFVAGVADREERDVSRIAIYFPAFFVVSIGRKVAFHSNNWLNASSLGRLYELDDSIHCPVVGNSEGIHPQLLCPIY